MQVYTTTGPSQRLPSRQFADIFVERYFADVNDILCVLSYNDFLSWYQPSYPERPLDPAKQVILYTVFAFGSRDDINGSADIYFSYALNAVGSIFGQAGLETIQALTLMVCTTGDLINARVCILCIRLMGLRRGRMLGQLFGLRNV